MPGSPRARQGALLDSLARKAKAQGYAARSAYKLVEVLEKYPALLRGARKVLDLGSVPGAWTQVLLERLPLARTQQAPNSPLVVGVDILDAPLAAIPPTETRAVGVTSDATHTVTTLSRVVAAIQNHTNAKSAPPLFDLVVSDAMANVSGVHELDAARSRELGFAALSLAVGCGAGEEDEVLDLGSAPGALPTDDSAVSMARELARSGVLKPNKARGGLVLKLFAADPAEDKALFNMLKANFAVAHRLRLAASRSVSREEYWVGIGRV